MSGKGIWNVKQTNTANEEGEGPMEEKKERNWYFCVVGNIVRTHYDENGILRHGTKAFKGGTKVYIHGRFDSEDRTTLDGVEELYVLGLNRFRRFALEGVPVGLIENVRVGRVYHPTVQKIMYHDNFGDGAAWYMDKVVDRKGTEAFVRLWYRTYPKKDGSTAKGEPEQDHGTDD